MARIAIDATIDAIYAAAADPDAWPEALEKVADYVGGSGALLVCNDIERNSGFLINGRLRDDLGELYVREYCNNPLVLAIARHGRHGVPVLGSSLIDRTSVARTAFGADILHPQRIVDQIALPHHALSGRNCSGGISVTLTERDMDDAMDGVRRLAQIAGHLSRALDLSLELARHRSEFRQLGTLLDILPSAALLLDSASRMVRANALAEMLLDADDGLQRTMDGMLCATIAEEDRRLRGALAAALRIAQRDITPHFQQSLAIARMSGLPPLLLILTPLPEPLFAIQGMLEGTARLLVQIVDPMGRLDARTDVLRSAYGLTHAEARVAGLIASGLTAPQAAKALGLSSATVRSHLARCFDKTGSRSQVGLAQLISVIMQG